MYKQINLETVSANLRAKRSYADLTIEELANQSGVNVSTLCKLLKGSNKDFRLSTLMKVAKSLDVSIEELLY